MYKQYLTIFVYGFLQIFLLEVEGKLNGPGENICEVSKWTTEYIQKEVPYHEWSQKTVKNHNCYCPFYYCKDIYSWKKIRGRWRCVKDVLTITYKTEYVCETVETFDYYCCDGFVEKNGKCAMDMMCQKNNGGCDQLCSSTSCSCWEGYEFDDATGKCSDINECKFDDNGGCSHTCKNTKGSYYCECPKGFQLLNHHKCQDINECKYEKGGCHHKCKNEIGDYACECNEGYELEEITKLKCEQISVCDHDGLSYEAGCKDLCWNGTDLVDNCLCDEFMTNKKTHCKEINECTENNGGCSHICLYENDQLSCDCPEGFTQISEQICQDIDECLINNGDCSHTCVNMNGTYECFCPFGYRLGNEGKSCIQGEPQFQKGGETDIALPSIITAGVFGLLFLCFIIFITVFFVMKMNRNKKSADGKPKVAMKVKAPDFEKGFDNHGYGTCLDDDVIKTAATAPGIYYSNATTLPNSTVKNLNCENEYSNACENEYSNNEETKGNLYSDHYTEKYPKPPTNPPPRLMEESETARDKLYPSLNELGK